MCLCIFCVESNMQHNQKLVVLAITLVVLIGVCTWYHCHTKSIVYMDYNGTTSIHPKALETYMSVSRNVVGNPSALCRESEQAQKILEDCRRDVAELLNCKQNELLFTSGATESNVIVIRGFVLFAQRAHRQCVIISTPIEHASVANTVASVAQDTGVNVVLVGVDGNGRVNMQDLQNILSTIPRNTMVLCSFIWINNEIGTIQDIRQIVYTVRSNSEAAHIHLDATQVVGRYAVDINDMEVDSVAFSGHKFRGPHGVGGLFLKYDSQILPIMTGGRQERGLRCGTEDIASIASMTTALRLAIRAMADGLVQRVFDLRNYLLDQIRLIPNVVIVNDMLYQDMNACAYNTLFFCVPCDSRKMAHKLSKHHGICIAVGSACSKGAASSTLRAIGIPNEIAEGSVRLSIGFWTTRRECEIVAKAIRKYVEQSLG